MGENSIHYLLHSLGLVEDADKARQTVADASKKVKDFFKPGGVLIAPPPVGFVSKRLGDERDGL